MIAPHPITCYLLLLFLLAPPSSSLFAFGPCPSIPSFSEYQISLKSSNSFIYSQGIFKAVDYLGTWYDILRNKDFKYATGNCTQSYLYITPEGKIEVLNSDLVHGKNNSGVAEVYIDPYTSGQILVRFSSWAPWGDYKVIITDYVSTALVFSCASYGLAHLKWAWVLARNTREKIPDIYLRAIEEYGIPMDAMHHTSHDICQN